jgi:hypothetical protein
MTAESVEWSRTYAATRSALHLVAAHIVARRRAAVTGRFGLRPTPGGFGTPMFGDEEVLRVDGDSLVRERRVDDRAVTSVISLSGATLTSLAMFADVDVTTPFSVGRDTPEIADPETPLEVSARDAAVAAGWYELGALAIDQVLVRLGAGGDPSVAQIWPEHFDLGIDVAAGETRANLGASPGDGYSPAPYLYVGPLTADRPGDDAYWNASFGALRTIDDIPDAEAADEFFAYGLALLAGA